MQDGSFVFLGHKWEQAKVSFFYKLIKNNEQLEFAEILEFSSPPKDIPEKLLKNVLDSLHLVLGISYYKLYCPKKIVLQEISLSEDQAEFWNTVYTKGLGEFFYKNKIDFRNLIEFPYSENTEVLPVPFSRKDRSLLGVGGGKDSIVAGELLKSIGKSFNGFVVNVGPIMEQTIQLLGVEKVTIKRGIDPLLFDLNKRPDAYNGHVPVSAQNAFIALLAAILYDYKYIVMANEESANYGSVRYLDQEINHQWSKSFEFELLFQNYVEKYLTPDVYYFSLLRPFSEIGITRNFVKFPKYFPVFSSCNKNFSIQNKAATRWCGECPKCVFTFSMLAAFLTKKELTDIFGQNLFSRTDLLQLYKELLGVEDIKPFDCVGTPEEVTVAFYQVMQNKEFANDPIIEYFQKEVLPSISDIESLKEKVFGKSEKHSIPLEFQEVLKT